MRHDLIADMFGWVNANEGVVSVLIFLLTLFLGWTSGIFASLRRRPKFRIELLQGPTFCSTFATGEMSDGYDVHRTAIALYLRIANIGAAPSVIKSVLIGYHWHLAPFSLSWLRYRLGWFWLQNQAIALSDFQVEIGDSVKFYPFMFQRSTMSGVSTDTYLQPGQSVNGVVYFEQRESWGGCFPSPRNARTKIIVAAEDIFGTKHKKRFWVPIVSLDEAKKYNPSFGETYPALKRGPTESTGDEEH